MWLVTPLFTLSFVAGLALARWAGIGSPVAAPLVWLGLSLIAVAFRRPGPMALSFLAVAFVAGLWRGAPEPDLTRLPTGRLELMLRVVRAGPALDTMTIDAVLVAYRTPGPSGSRMDGASSFPACG